MNKNKYRLYYYYYYQLQLHVNSLGDKGVKTLNLIMPKQNGTNCASILKKATEVNQQTKIPVRKPKRNKSVMFLKQMINGCRLC